MPEARELPTSSSASLGFWGSSRVSYAARTTYLRFGDLVNLGEHHGRFIFERGLHRFVVLFRVFPRAVLETQVSEIIVDGVASLHQMIELGTMRSEIRSIRLDVEDKQKRRDGQREASAEHRAVR